MIRLFALSGAGYNVITAKDGSESIELVKEAVPDLIIMDLQMPKMSGFDAIEEIRKQYNSANLPIIVLSSERSKKEWTKALKVGANDFVPKPYDKTELFARINTNLKVADLTNRLGIKTQELFSKNELLEKEMKLAVKVQNTILPLSFQCQGLEIESFYRPLHSLSGDFFDAFEEKQKLTLMIGDVTGQGISAALIMFAAKSTLHSFGKADKSPTEIISLVNQLFYEMLKESGFSLSLVFIVINTEINELLFISAGHNPVVLFGRSGLRSIESTGPRLGLNLDATWAIEKRSFVPGDGIFLFTDGLIEATDGQENKFSIDRLLVELAKDIKPKKQISNAFNAVKHFCNDNFSDDITMLSIRRN